MQSDGLFINPGRMVAVITIKLIETWSLTESRNVMIERYSLLHRANKAFARNQSGYCIVSAVFWATGMIFLFVALTLAFTLGREVGKIACLCLLLTASIFFFMTYAVNRNCPEISEMFMEKMLYAACCAHKDGQKWSVPCDSKKGARTSEKLLTRRVSSEQIFEEYRQLSRDVKISLLDQMKPLALLGTTRKPEVFMSLFLSRWSVVVSSLHSASIVDEAKNSPNNLLHDAEARDYPSSIASIHTYVEVSSGLTDSNREDRETTSLLLQ